MPKNTLKRLLPSPAGLRKIRGLGLLGEWIYQPNLWHLNRMSSSRAFFIGLFMAFMPIPLQMVVAALAAIWLRANLPLAVALCWITNPLTFAPIFYLAYRVGAATLGVSVEEVEFSLTWEWLTQGLLLIWQPFLLGCFLCGFFFGSAGFFSINYLWRWKAGRAWRERRRRRREKLDGVSHDVALRLATDEKLAGQDTAPLENTSQSSPR